MKRHFSIFNKHKSTQARIESIVFYDDNTDEDDGMTDREFLEQFSYREAPKQVKSYAKKLRLINYYHTKADNTANDRQALKFRHKAEGLEGYAREQATEIYAGRDGPMWLDRNPEDTSFDPYHPSNHHTLPMPRWRVGF